ncbi:MAG: hypothetical protein GDA46_06405 [Bdellovibrionales bacterium]|nr:hypothetical protein [Bdellovibrionales bacterium]
MKIILFLFLFLSTCKGKSVRKDREFKGGTSRFEFSNLENLVSLEDLDDLDKCKTYDNHLQKGLWGEHSPANLVVNCIAYYVDKGVEPLCNLEKEVREEIRVERDSSRRKALEATLEEINYKRENYIENMYNLADPIYDSCNELKDTTEDGRERFNEDSKILGTLFNMSVNITVNRECRRIYGVIDSKINTACSGLNVSTKRKLLK